MFEATVHLLLLSTKLFHGTENHLRLLKAIVTLIFTAALHLSTLSDLDTQQKFFKRNVDKVRQYLIEWISNSYVIGREMFGGDKTVYQRRAVEELKVRYRYICSVHLYAYYVFYQHFSHVTP